MSDSLPTDHEQMMPDNALDTIAPAAAPESVEAMRTRARHRLIGASVLVVLGVIGFPLLFSLGKLIEGINDAGFILNFIQVGLIDKIDNQAFFGTIAHAGTNHAADFFHQFGFVLGFLVMLKD